MAGDTGVYFVEVRHFEELLDGPIPILEENPFDMLVNVQECNLYSKVVIR